MNQSDLESILRKARLPEIPEESLEMFPRRIAARLKRDDLPVHTARQFSPQLAWAFGLAACIIIAIGIGFKHRWMETGNIPARDSLTSLKVIHETLATFPNQVRAIVEDEHGLRLILADNTDVPTSPPLYVRICNGEHCVSFVTFSGQEIQVAGQNVTVLSDAHGGIILTGNRFVWSNIGRSDVGSRLKIEARNLGPAAM
jgi:hypothetical protein